MDHNNLERTINQIRIGFYLFHSNSHFRFQLDRQQMRKSANQKQFLLDERLFGSAEKLFKIKRTYAKVP